MPGQFSNPANPEIHSITTAQELWQDTDGRMAAFVAGVGTGGTLTGVGRVWKNRRPAPASWPSSRPIHPFFRVGSPGAHRIQGIGAGFIPDNVDTSLIDEVLQVSNEESFATARRLAREEGILAGISSGAACAAALELAARDEYADELIVFIAPSTAERYISTDLFEGLG